MAWKKNAFRLALRHERGLTFRMAVLMAVSCIAFSAAQEITRLNMKSYGNHDAVYDARIVSIRPSYVIDNPAHGLYGEMESPQYTASWLLQNVQQYQDAGIKVIGYITGGYEGSSGDDGYGGQWYSLEMNRKLISNMAALDHVDGVFIDECSDFPNAASKEYLQNLSSLAHDSGLIVWGNTGVDEFDEWYFNEGGFDLIQSSENWAGQELSDVQTAYGCRISVTGFNSSYNADDAILLTKDAWDKGIGFCYINTVEYTSIATWFEAYADSLRAVQDTYAQCPAEVKMEPYTRRFSGTRRMLPVFTAVMFGESANFQAAILGRAWDLRGRTCNASRQAAAMRIAFRQ